MHSTTTPVPTRNVLVAEVDEAGIGTRSWEAIKITSLGNAAARETLLTATPHMAALWTDLFAGLLAGGQELRWAGDGMGVGKDARSAYSNLLGRFMARRYLVEKSGCKVLIPLDLAKRRLEGTAYEIGKLTPADKGDEADWIGLDATGLVIAEAKGSHNDGRTPWRGGGQLPQCMRTAIGQARRTCIRRRGAAAPLPARRWAIASRWATSKNGREPVLLAWDPEPEPLSPEDFNALAKLFTEIEVDTLLGGLGHPEARRLVNDENLGADEPALSSHLRIGDVRLEPGLAAAFGAFGVRRIGDDADLAFLRQALALGSPVAVVSLAIAAAQERRRRLRDLVPRRTATANYALDSDLEVTWPERGMSIEIETISAL